MSQSPLVAISYISKATQDMGVLALMRLTDQEAQLNQKLDPRHQQVRLLKMEDIKERSFPAWSMHFFLAKEIVAKMPSLTGVLDGLPEHDVELLRLMRSAAE